MGERGPRPSSELSVVSINAYERPAAPEELTQQQAEEWRAIVRRLPPDWFKRETWPLLAQLCRHVVNARRVATMIERSCDTIYEFDKLLRMQERESKAIASLSTKLRITQQSTYDAKKAATAKNKFTGPFPWENLD